MTTIYVPRLIESAEKAEALPVGTIARHSSGPGMDHAHKVSTIGRDVWVAIGGNSTNASMVGWMALVPIEAEAVRSEFTGIGFATERLAGGPFTAYYVHEREA